MAGARAFVSLRLRPEYRFDSFAAGLRARGYEVVPGVVNPGSRVRPDDVLVVWNVKHRDAEGHRAARAAGARVLVAENGYVSPDAHGREYYSLALGGHNGSGRWREGGPERWDRLGVPIREWSYRPGGHVLVCGQRGIGSDEMKSPPGFEHEAEKRVRALLAGSGRRREVRVRRHPGRHQGVVPLEQDLAGAAAVVVWSSNVANLALLRGVPAFAMAPFHANSAVSFSPHMLAVDALWADLDTHFDRHAGFRRLAWHQWHVREIESGEPFRVLLSDDADVRAMPWVGRSGGNARDGRAAEAA